VVNMTIRNIPQVDLPDNPRDMAGYFSTISDDDYKGIMDYVGDLQRGRPESVMIKAQREMGGGVYPHSLEHVGDLTHRINEHGGRLGTEFVRPKVESQLRQLTHPYGYEREMLEQINSNRSFAAERGRTAPDLDRIRELGANYAAEHRAIPVINRPTALGRSAAINLGEMQFGSTIRNLRGLQALTDDTDRYRHEISRQGAIDYLKEVGE
jgi:hypothetical protein